ncbi:MAG: transposase [Lentimonas sp.]
MHQIKGVVYTKIKMIEGTKDPRIIAEVQPPWGSKPQCSGGEKRSATDDHMPTARLFEFIAMFNIPVFLENTMRGVDCADCGVKGYSSGIVEGLNLKINMGIRKAYECRSFDIMKIALLHQVGDFPEPEFPHRFC